MHARWIDAVGRVIPSGKPLDAGSFDRDEIKMLVSVWEDALRELQLDERHDALANLVAQRILSLARRGERDPIGLRRVAMLAALDRGGGK